MDFLNIVVVFFAGIVFLGMWFLLHDLNLGLSRHLMFAGLFGVFLSLVVAYLPLPLYLLSLLLMIELFFFLNLHGVLSSKVYVVGVFILSGSTMLFWGFKYNTDWTNTTYPLEEGQTYYSVYKDYQRLVASQPDSTTAVAAVREMEKLIPYLAQAKGAEKDSIITDFIDDFCLNPLTKKPAYVADPNKDGDGIWVCGWYDSEYSKYAASTPGDLAYVIYSWKMGKIPTGETCGPYYPIDQQKITYQITQNVGQAKKEYYLDMEANITSFHLYSLKENMVIAKINLTAEKECPLQTTVNTFNTHHPFTNSVSLDQVLDWVKPLIP